VPHPCPVVAQSCFPSLQTSQASAYLCQSFPPTGLFTTLLHHASWMHRTPLHLGTSIRPYLPNRIGQRRQTTSIRLKTSVSTPASLMSLSIEPVVRYVSLQSNKTIWRMAMSPPGWCTAFKSRRNAHSNIVLRWGSEEDPHDACKWYTL
jgi:hypothetical protein